MNHRDFSKINKNKTVVDASIDIGNFTFTPCYDGLKIKSKDPSNPVEKGIGYIRTPEGMEINFDPKSFSINRELGAPDTINIEGVLLPTNIKRHIMNSHYGLSPKCIVIDETHEYFSPKDKEKLKACIERNSSKKAALVIFDEVHRMRKDLYNELCEMGMNNQTNHYHYEKPITLDDIFLPESVKEEIKIKAVEKEARTIMEGMNKSVIIEKKVNVPHEIKDVIFNDPATIVFWKDGTKTVVKAQNGEVFDPEKGLAMAFFKKMHGNAGNYNNIIHKWVGDYKPEEREPRNTLDTLAFGYSEYSMEIDFPKDLTSEEIDCMKTQVVRGARLHLDAIRATSEMRKSSDAE